MGADGGIADDDEITLRDHRLDGVPDIGKAGQEGAEDRLAFRGCREGGRVVGGVGGQEFSSTVRSWC